MRQVAWSVNLVDSNAFDVHAPRTTTLIRPMKAAALLLFALPLLATAAPPPTTLLKAEVEGNTVVIYSSLKKAGGCKAAVMFSYRHGDERVKRKLECNFRVPAQDHYRFCEFYDPQFVDLKIESAIVGGCE